MGILFQSGDLFCTPGIRAYAHGCNCAGAMGKGIALEFRKRWPAMYAEYRRRCAGGEFVPGDTFVWDEDDMTVFNLGTQRTWRTPATLEAITESVRRMIGIAGERGITLIDLPRIGAGLGGLPWDMVKGALKELSEGSRVMLLVCEEYEQGVPMELGDI